MRVGIDAAKMLVPTQTGVQRYTTSLILEMARQLSDYPGLELVLYFHTQDPHVNPALLSAYLPRLERAKIRTWQFSRGYRVALPLMAIRDGVKLLHLPEPYPLRFSACPTLITMHDLCWARLAPEIVAGERAADMADANKAIRQASAFIAVSNSTRDDLIAEYDIAPERIRVTYEGVEEKYQADPEAADIIRDKYGLNHYILCVSTLQRRKNLVRLIEAFAGVLAQHNIPHKLVLVGSKGWGYEEVYAAVERLNLQERVVFPNYVPDEELPGLYTQADLFVYPSLYEGFGLPVLEAMACGAPVAVANNSSLPEVAGDAGLYFDPLDVEEMARTLYEAIDNVELNKDLRRRSLAQARQFTWQATARQTLNAYHSLANKPLNQLTMSNYQ